MTQADDSAEEGSDLEGNRWHVGVDDDDEDSDIDSEDAFGESDEEKFADFTFRGSTGMATKVKKGKTAKAFDLEESGVDSEQDRSDGSQGEDDMDDDLGDEAVDLATAWDMNDEAENEVANKRKRKHIERQESDGDEEQLSGSASIDDQFSEEEDDGKSQFSVSDDEGDHHKLQSFVEGLTNSASAKPSKRRPEAKNLPNNPSQFGLSSLNISAADLMQYIKDPRQRQSLKVLQNREEAGHSVYNGGVPGKLAPPLARRQQDRIDRSAAYDESKKELSKWIETVKRNRRAEHISFPLEDPAAMAALSGKQLGPTSQSNPMTSLESTIQEIMVESGMLSKEHRSLDDQEQAYEELHEKKLPLDEVQARRAELRKTRDLMFREEIRARRIKKIKSKAYRRVHRKERQKANLETRNLLATHGMIDSEEEREKNDRRRAEERMGARHRESKWAKSVKVTGRAAWDEDARHGVTDLARRDEELRRRIEGKAAQVGSDERDSESSDSDEFSGTDDERDRLQVKLNGLDQDAPQSTESRLGSMAFMKKAEAARKATNDEEIESIRRSLHQEGDGSHGEVDSEIEEPTGRRKFGQRSKPEDSKPAMPAQKSEFEERESDADFTDADEHGEGGLAVAATKASAHRGETLKRSKQLPLAKEAAKARFQLDHSEKGTSRHIPQAGNISEKQAKAPHPDLDDYSSPSESEEEQDSKSALAQAIFAGPDEIERDFAKEKKETVEEEGDQIIDGGLPGWGSWAGEGVSKKAQKRAKGRFLTTIKGIDKEKRQDAKLERVIINEKQVKKNSKYLATELPHPFESRQQYERSLRLPLGPEWTTKSTFQDATKPRVLVKQGIIRPMARPLV